MYTFSIKLIQLFYTTELLTKILANFISHKKKLFFCLNFPFYKKFNDKASTVGKSCFINKFQKFHIIQVSRNFN